MKIKVAGVANEAYNARPEYEDLKELSRYGAASNSRLSSPIRQ